MALTTTLAYLCAIGAIAAGARRRWSGAARLGRAAYAIVPVGLFLGLVLGFASVGVAGPDHRGALLSEAVSNLIYHLVVSLPAVAVGLMVRRRARKWIDTAGSVSDHSVEK